MPWALSISAMTVVVVVLPSLPVTAMIGHGHSSKNISISDVTAIPRRRASVSSGSVYFIPGVRNTMSPSKCAR